MAPPMATTRRVVWESMVRQTVEGTPVDFADLPGYVVRLAETFAEQSRHPAAADLAVPRERQRSARRARSVSMFATFERRNRLGERTIR